MSTLGEFFQKELAGKTFPEGLLEGEIERTVPGSELTLSIDTFEMNDTELLAGDITFSDEAGEITKPEGERRNIMRMTQADWYKILFEIAGNLYSFGG